MIKILGANSFNPQDFFKVTFPEEDFNRITTYLALWDINPFENWGSWQPAWDIAAKENKEEWRIESNYYYDIAWNKKYENIIHDFNNLFYPDQLCEHNDKDTV